MRVYSDFVETNREFVTPYFDSKSEDQTGGKFFSQLKVLLRRRRWFPICWALLSYHIWTWSPLVISLVVVVMLFIFGFHALEWWSLIFVLPLSGFSLLIGLIWTIGNLPTNRDSFNDEAYHRWIFISLKITNESIKDRELFEAISTSKAFLFLNKHYLDI